MLHLSGLIFNESFPCTPTSYLYRLLRKSEFLVIQQNAPGLNTLVFPFIWLPVFRLILERVSSVPQLSLFLLLSQYAHIVYSHKSVRVNLCYCTYLPSLVPEPSLLSIEIYLYAGMLYQCEIMW